MRLPLRIALVVTHWQTLPMPMFLTSGWGAEGMTKSRMIAGLMLSLAAALFASGCAQTRGRVTRNATPRPLGGGAVVASSIPPARPLTDGREPEISRATEADSQIQLASAEQPAQDKPSDSKTIPPEPDAVGEQSAPPLLLDDVIGSVVASYPLLQAAMFGRNIAQIGRAHV